MIFPKSTEFNRRIHKTTFYENLNISPALKRAFIEQIKIIDIHQFCDDWHSGCFFRLQ